MITGAGDLKDLNIVGNMPKGGREYNWSTMCDAMPYWKGKEMKRSYYACIRCSFPHFVSLTVASTHLSLHLSSRLL